MDTEPQFFDTNATPGVVGQPLNRVDGWAKVTGQAKYSAEYNSLPGLVHAVLKTSDVAKGRVTGFDTTAAMKQPGVVAILTHQNLPKPVKVPDSQVNKGTLNSPMGFFPMLSDEVHYAGQPVAIVVADTLEHAQYAAALLKVNIAPETPVSSYQDPKAERYVPKNVKGTAGVTKRGDAQAAFQSAPVQLTATYTHATNHHNPMEPGATTAHWEAPDRLTVYDTTQGVSETQKTLALMLGLATEQVRVVTKYLGGGFGCKAWVWPHVVLAPLAAKAVSRPVKLVLTRQQQYTGMGHREEQEQTLRLGATKDGKLLGIVHEKTSTTSPWDDYAETNSRIINMLYALPAFESTYHLAKASVMTSTSTRAPGDMPGSFALECSMDDLAYQLGIDPIQLRLLNYAEKDPTNGHPWSSKSLKQCYQRGAELFGWNKRNPKNGQTRDGKTLVGWGMATASYPVHNSQGNARVRLYADGRAVVQAGATDLGTGTYTIITQVAADALGLPPENIRFELGDTILPSTQWSGGSTAAGRVSSSVYLAAQDVWQKLIKLAVADKNSPLYGAKSADVEMGNGRLQLKAKPATGEAFTEVMKRASLGDVEGNAQGRYGSVYREPSAAADADMNKEEKEAAAGYSMHAFGAHFCEVHVDPELGTVRVARWVSVMSAGRILNPKTARSQVIGGTIFGIGSALMEQTVRDPHWARYTNADLANYHIPVNADIPDMTVDFIDEHDPHVNAMGVKGIGEIAIVGVTAAVANAFFHATGRRLRSLPMTPDKVLDALRQPA
ncbi:xanthine dehydrogenase family protein molybdopterin-binding subunit [Hymenobacter sp. HSC-4F20]|uniref:xanthine dehydrogenase family protein molybdopterin-binding subunit n=1 Tax=Hymenobacter sp. HSC-4F20 TaxID=2864135 RepID=UPI001C72F7E0|nr:xanthine dehydrogenase family protein molybdopterin-binding subunit [Hymenobacter sp. HSC-4F20]MBX0291000.1 xanthine dehydrogenase family protein molybdopterin-binding subunit [Hymenobacter sp. HSC-4F20]